MCFFLHNRSFAFTNKGEKNRLKEIKKIVSILLNSSKKG